jgi:hypothetical protein
MEEGALRNRKTKAKYFAINEKFDTQLIVWEYRPQL